MIFRHRKKQPTPNTQTISGRFPEIAELINEIMHIISDMSVDIYDDLKSLEKFESFTSTTIPIAEAGLVGKGVVVTSGADVSVHICIVTGASYGWKKFQLL